MYELRKSVQTKIQAQISCQARTATVRCVSIAFLKLLHANGVVINNTAIVMATEAGIIQSKDTPYIRVHVQT